MNYSLKPENREFIRVNTKFPVKFKFIIHKQSSSAAAEMSEGTVTSLGGGGMLLEGPLNDRTWIPKLVMQKIIVGVKFSLPNDDKTIAALCRVAWVKGVEDDDSDQNHVQFGLMFREISFRDRDRIFDFVIHNQLG